MIKRKNKRQSLKSSAPQYEGRKYGRPKLFRYGELGIVGPLLSSTEMGSSQYN